MKTYEARVFGNVFIEGDGPSRPLPPCLGLCSHSPTGFAWGYNGSGPAQLAFAIIFDLTGNAAAAHRYHQQFKARAIATVNRDGRFSLTEDRAREVLEAVTREGEAGRREGAGKGR